MATILLGWMALMVLILCGCCLFGKKPLWALLCSIGTMVLTYFTAYTWKYLLIVSGKDTTLLGFHRYPTALVLLVVLTVFAIAGMIISIIWMARRKKQHQN